MSSPYNFVVRAFNTMCWRTSVGESNDINITQKQFARVVSYIPLPKALEAGDRGTFMPAKSQPDPTRTLWPHRGRRG